MVSEDGPCSCYVCEIKIGLLNDKNSSTFFLKHCNFQEHKEQSTVKPESLPKRRDTANDSQPHGHGLTSCSIVLRLHQKRLQLVMDAEINRDSQQYRRLAGLGN